MHPITVHKPGSPDSDSPPERLLRLIERYQPQHPVVRWGLTVTQDGQWAMLISVSPDTEIPIESVETYCEGFPIVYEAEPETPIHAQHD